MDKAKDFEKCFEEYKAKKKQEIEELGQDIYDNCPDLCENGCGGKPCYKCIAKALHRDNYRKIPENAVVLTREEYEKLKLFEERVRSGVCFTQKEWFDYCQKDSNERTSLLIKAKKDTRKETAEKFARLVEFHSVSTRDEEGREIFTISALGLKEILHEEFGIPYDEICKEITDKGVQNGN